MIKLLALFMLLFGSNAAAWDCKFKVELDESLDVSSSESLSIIVGAGDLKISGISGSSEVAIHGTVCVSEEEWLDQVQIEATTGDTAEITVSLPDSDGWSLWGNRYAYVDLELEVPNSLALQLQDSSGDIEVESTASLSVKDSSGDIEITDVSGNLEISDSSGDIKVLDLEGDLTIISDSSGDIRGADIEGNVLVESDSSGDIRFTRVGRDVVVERDSSGDIEVDTVAGDFTVLKDGSGDIDSKRVEGKVSIPDHKS